MSSKNCSWAASSLRFISLAYQQLHHAIQNLVRHHTFSHERDLLDVTGRINQCCVIHIAVEGRIRTTCGVDNNQVQIFSLQFFQTMLDMILGFGCKTNEHFPVLVQSEFLKNVGCGLQMKCE